MKRHSSLISLSHDHHQALILAQLLKKDNPGYKGLPREPKEKAIYAFNFYRQHLVKHFSEEEQVIQKIKGIKPEMDEISDEIIKEHSALTRLFEEISTCGDIVDQLNQIGTTLEQHIRKEERVFFPMIQQYCDEMTLNEIETLLSD